MKFTVTHCERYPRYYPEEGGYYTTCHDAIEWVTVKTYRQAKKYFNKMVKENGYTKRGRNFALDDLGIETKYHGEGKFISIKRGSDPDRYNSGSYC